MEKKSARENDSSEKETDDANRSSDPTQEEEATDSQSEEPNSPVGNARKAGRSGSVQASAVGGTPSGQKDGSHSSGGGYVNYDRGSDPGALSARYGMEVRDAEAGELQRLEREFGRDRVSRWAEEGMTVETMGKPRDMQAFRTRQEERSDEIPTDIERQNKASSQRSTAREREDGPAGETSVPDEVRSVISSPGRAMDETVQREMESKMGGDFSDVQVHTGPKAAAAAESINARAFTVGNHVAFNEGEYQPESPDGKKMLAHELTHVRQQTEGSVSLLPKADVDHPGAGVTVGTSVDIQPELRVRSPDDPAEKQAEEVARKATGRDGEETAMAGADVDASAATESADSADTDRARAGTEAGSDASAADVDGAGAESAASEPSDTETDGAEPDQARAETATESADSVQRTPDADTAGQQGDSGADSDSGAAADSTSQGSASVAEGTVDEAVNPDEAAATDASLAVGGPGDSPNDGGNSTISVGRRVLRAPTSGISDANSPIEALYGHGPLQPKLAVSSPDDPAEREAREVAEQVMETDPATKQTDEGVGNQGETDTSRAIADPISRSPGGTEVSADKASTVRTGVRGNGKPLPAKKRSEFEAKMGADFSDVQVHTDARANEAARSINAEAYTIGSDIAFASGNYSPESNAGKRLLAHELTHVLQQDGATPRTVQRVRPEEYRGGGAGRDGPANKEQMLSEAKRQGANIYNEISQQQNISLQGWEAGFKVEGKLWWFPKLGLEFDAFEVEAPGLGTLGLNTDVVEEYLLLDVTEFDYKVLTVDVELDQNKETESASESLAAGDESPATSDKEAAINEDTAYYIQAEANLLEAFTAGLSDYAEENLPDGIGLVLDGKVGATVSINEKGNNETMLTANNANIELAVEMDLNKLTQEGQEGTEGEEEGDDEEDDESNYSVKLGVGFESETDYGYVSDAGGGDQGQVSHGGDELSQATVKAKLLAEAELGPIKWDLSQEAKAESVGGYAEALEMVTKKARVAAMVKVLSDYEPEELINAWREWRDQGRNRDRRLQLIEEINRRYSLKALEYSLNYAQAKIPDDADLNRDRYLAKPDDLFSKKGELNYEIDSIAEKGAFEDVQESYPETARKIETINTLS